LSSPLHEFCLQRSIVDLQHIDEIITKHRNIDCQNIDEVFELDLVLFFVECREGMDSKDTQRETGYTYIYRDLDRYTHAID